MPRSAAPLALPKHWKHSICSALIRVISLAHFALLASRGRASRSRNQRVRQTAKTDQLGQEIGLLREEIRIKDARMERVPANRRPHYQPSERLAILELRAARGWSLAQTGTVFHLTTATIASWTKRLDEQGPAALVRTPTPVNSAGQSQDRADPGPRRAPPWCYHRGPLSTPETDADANHGCRALGKSCHRPVHQRAVAR